MILESLEVTAQEFGQRAGWAIKPEGACHDDRCIPLPPHARTAVGKLDVRVLAERLAMPLVYDEAVGLWALGPESGGRALVTAQSPELKLPDWRGNEFTLSSLLGRKVLLVAWASW